MAQEQAKSPAEGGAEAMPSLEGDLTPERDYDDGASGAADKKPSLAERLREEQRKAAVARGETAKPLDQDSNGAKAQNRGRRAAGPAQRRMATAAANDDLPSIGGLIFALQQKPSKAPFVVAFFATLAWLFIGGLFAYGLMAQQAAGPASLSDMLSNPSSFTAAVTVVIPIALFWFLALLVWRAQELRLMASAMSEVAVRLAEPDKLAEQSVASLGQTIRRQVAAMNDAISRAIGRAGELEALVHNEVAALERSYSDNELRVRGLITELASERQALSNNSERVSEALRGVGAQIAQELAAASGNIDKKLSERGQEITDILVLRSNEAAAQVDLAHAKVQEQMPALLERLGQEQERLGQVIEGAAVNLQALETAVGERTTALDLTVKERTEALSSSLASRIKALETSVGQGALILDTTLKDRTESLEAAISEHSQSLDKTLAERTEAFASSVAQGALGLDGILKERTKLLTSSVAEETEKLGKTLTGGLETFAATVGQGATGLDGLLRERTRLLATSIGEEATKLDKTLTERITTFAQSVGHGATGLDKLMRDRIDLLHNAIGQGAERIDRTLSQRTEALAAAVNQGATGLDRTLAERTESFANALLQRSKAVENAITQQAATMDKTLTDRSQAVIGALTERLGSIDAAFSQRTNEIDRVLAEHKRVVESTFGRQALQLNEMLATNSSAIRQTAEQAGIQSKEAVNILTNQTQTLREVSRGLLEQIHSLTQRFENQGQAILTAAKALDSSNTKIDSILENRHQAIIGVLHAVNAKGQELDNMMRSYSGVVETALSQVEQRAKQVGATLARDTTGQAQAALTQIERLREEAQAHTQRAVGDLKSSFETVITQIGRQLEQTRSEFDHTSRGMRDAAQKTATDLDQLRQDMQRRMESLPQQTAQATAAIRKALSDQLREIEAITPALGRPAPQANGAADPYRPQLASRSEPPLTLRNEPAYGGYDAPPPRRPYDQGQGGDIGQVAGGLAAQLSNASGAPRQGWDYGQAAPEAGGYGARGGYAPQPAAFPLRLDEIARAMDRRTAEEIWDRFRAGEQGVLGRHLYNPDGQVTFDEISRRYDRDQDFRGTVDRYMADFERLLTDAEQTDPEGKVGRHHMASETGRVYLLLGHASGRLR